MNGVTLLAAGAAFVGMVVVGFAAGIYVARQTGASWWALVGVLGGLVLGTLAVARQFRRALH